MAAPNEAGSPEVYFAQKLAGNEKKIRDQAVKRLKKWLRARSNVNAAGFTEEDMLKIWKGLHYCMWMSDKPLVQEELADNLCSLISSFGTLDGSFMFINTFYKTQSREWFGIDRLRLDKFMMLYRRFLDQCLLLVKKNGCDTKHVTRLVDILKSEVMFGASSPDGLKFHLADMYVSELSKVMADQLNSANVMLFLTPWIDFLASSKSKALVKHVIKRVFMELVLQSELNPFNDDSEDDDEGKGEAKEDSKLAVEYMAVADSLFKVASSQACVGRNRKPIYDLVTKFRDLQQGRFPLDEIQESSDEDLTNVDIDAAVKRLASLEKSQATKKRKHSITGDGVVGGKKRRKKTSASETSEVTEGSEDHGASIADKEDVNQKKKKKKRKNPEGDKMGDRGDVGNEGFGEVKRNGETERTSVDTSGGEGDVPGKLMKTKSKKSLDGNQTLNGFVDKGSESVPKKKKKGVKSGTDASSTSLKTDQLFDEAAWGEEVVSKKKKRKSSATANSFIESNASSDAGTGDFGKETIVRKSKKGAKVADLTEMSPVRVECVANDNLQKAVTVSPGKPRKSTNNEAPDLTQTFAKIEKVKTTPPAFVRKAMSKVTPRTEPKKKLAVKSTPMSEPSQGKRVSFIMSKNTMQEFKKNTPLASPSTPVNLSGQPNQGILKSTPVSASSKGKKKFTSVTKAKRSKAADFF